MPSMIPPSGALVAMVAMPFLALGPPATAPSDVVLTAPAPVRIWKSMAAMEQGRDLLDASASPDAAALAPLLVCEVAPGTRATVTRAEHSYAWEAEVTEGPQRGCRGVIGPRDFNTEAELLPRSPVEVHPPASTGRSDRRAILWYQLDMLAHDGRAQTAWKSVAGWETDVECEGARRRLMEANEQEVRDILDRFEVASRASRGKIAMRYAPREYGLDLELSNLTREGGTSLHIEIRNYCFPAGYDPRR
jgi:hypothetical protein